MHPHAPLKTLLASLCVGAAGCPVLAQFSVGSGGRDDGPPVRASLVSETTALVPGETTHLGLHFDIADNWYLYWKNPGDSGMPPSFTLELPEGMTALDTQWPAPERHVLPGDILDYVYRHGLTLIVPIEAASDLTAGGTATVRARIAWLMCRDEVCVPGSAEVSITLPVSTAAERTPHAPKFERTRARTPRTAAPGEIEWRWEGRTLALRAPGATSLTFFPAPSEHAHPRGMIAAGVSASGALRIEYDQRVDRVSEVGAVLEVRRPDGAREFIEFVIPGPSPG